MVNNLLDLYSDYLVASTGATTAIGLSKLLEGSVSHDQVTRFLRDSQIDSKQLWNQVKPIAEEISDYDAVLVIDDSIEEKRYTDQNELICWHYDHTVNRSVKGVNFVTALYYSKGVSLPVAVEFVEKNKFITDKKTGKQKRISERTKNEIFRDLVRISNRNVHFRYVLSDCWFSSGENMTMIKLLGKDVVMAIKSNRNVALSEDDKKQGKYVSIESLALKQDTVTEVYFEQVDFALLLTKQVFKNEDDSTGELYLVTSDLSLTYLDITTIYQKRWKVEEFHKSVKSNASFAKSPTKTVQTQRNHFFASILAFVKLERMKLKNDCNHFALKSKIYMDALKAAFNKVALLSTYPNQLKLNL
jgi:hypothetical protein